jgi:hypothetical protein
MMVSRICHTIDCVVTKQMIHKTPYTVLVLPHVLLQSYDVMLSVPSSFGSHTAGARRRYVEKYRFLHLQNVSGNISITSQHHTKRPQHSG